MTPVRSEVVSSATVDRIRAEAARFGSIGFDRFMDLALYGPEGFFTSGRGAGRTERDFVTSPEIGPLFGICVAGAIDREWEALGRPDPFIVIEAGAGNGRLCREVLRARPECAAALRYVLVETSATLRAEQRERLAIEPPEAALGAFLPGVDDDPPESVEHVGPIVTQLAELPALAFDGMVLANELLDNLPFALAECDGAGWNELRIDASLQYVPVALAAADVAAVAPFADAQLGARVPLPRVLGPWFADVRATLRRGVIIAVDYAVTGPELLDRGAGWLRTYRDHQRGGDPLVEPGAFDITADVVVEHVIHAALAAGFGEPTTRTQADWLRDLGIDELVDEGERIWTDRAAIGDLVALEARSRRAQARALTDQASVGSLGNFTVFRIPAP